MAENIILIAQLISIFLYSFKYHGSQALLIMSAILFVLTYIYSILFGMSRKLADFYSIIFAISGIVTGLYGKDIIMPIFSFLISIFLILYPFSGKITKNFKIRKSKKDPKTTEHVSYKYINIYSLTSDEFKNFTTELLEKLGYKIEKTLNSQENGVDLVVTMEGGKRLIVMIRRYKGLISTKLLQRLFEIMLEENADGGIFITTSDFSASSYRLSESKPIKLINGKELNELSRDLLKVDIEI